MTDLSQLRTLEQIATERAVLERRAKKQEAALEQETRSLRRMWQSRWSKVERFGSILGMLMPKVSQGTLALTLLSRLIRRFRH